MNSPKRTKSTTSSSSTTTTTPSSSFITSVSRGSSNSSSSNSGNGSTSEITNRPTATTVADAQLNNQDKSEERDNIFSPRRYSLGEVDLSPPTAKSDDILKEDEANVNEQQDQQDEDDTYHFSYETLLACEYEDDDEFDPFKFVAVLPPKKPIRPSAYCLPPKKSNAPAITLVLDLDETLVHCSTDPMPGADFTFPVLFHGVEYQVYVRKRPFFEDFLKLVSQMFEVVVFTASQKVYADKLLDILDPKRQYISHRVFRDSCVYVDGNYLKDLEVLGRDVTSVVIIDNSPQAYGYHFDNGIPIMSWFEDESDRELEKLIPFLKKLQKTNDVRPAIRQKFKFKQLIDKYKDKIGLHNRC